LLAGLPVVARGSLIMLSRRLMNKNKVTTLFRRQFGGHTQKGPEPYPTFEWKHDVSVKPYYVNSDKAYFLGIKPGTPWEFWEYPTYFVLGLTFALTIYGIMSPVETMSVCILC
jgi:hypothetical protein